MPIDEMDNCPDCGAVWKGEDIFQYFLNESKKEGNWYSGRNEVEIMEMANSYGYTIEDPKYFKINFIGIETSDYDGVSFWRCMACETFWNRWNNQKIDKSTIKFEEQ